MKINGNHLNQQSMALQGIKGKAAAVQNRIRGVQQELSRLDQKKELSKEEQKKKQALERELAELQQQLSEINRESKEEIQEEQKQQDENADVKEPGKGELVDERI